MLPDLHIGFSRGRSGGLVFPSLSEFSTVYCDPHSQRLWHSQESINRCFSGTLCFFHDLTDVGNLISGSSPFSKTSFNIRKFTVHVLLKPSLENFVITHLGLDSSNFLPPSFSKGFPCGSAGKESSCNAGDLDSIPGLVRPSWTRKGYPFQYSGLENSMDCIVHGVAKSQTGLGDFHFSSFSKLVRSDHVKPNSATSLQHCRPSSFHGHLPSPNHPWTFTVVPSLISLPPRVPHSNFSCILLTFICLQYRLALVIFVLFCLKNFYS